jgi:hypothetical protein
MARWSARRHDGEATHAAKIGVTMSWSAREVDRVASTPIMVGALRRAGARPADAFVRDRRLARGLEARRRRTAALSAAFA